VSPVRQRTSTHLIAKDIGLIDDVHLRQLAAIRRNCENTIATNWDNADTFCTGTLDYISSMTGGVNNYDASIFGNDVNPY